MNSQTATFAPRLTISTSEAIKGRSIPGQQKCKPKALNCKTNPKSLITVFALILVCGQAFCQEPALSGSKLADKVVARAPLPEKTVGPASGLVAFPLVDGAVVNVDAGQMADSVKQVGWWQTIKNIPASYPKTTTAISVLAAAIPVLANNPKLLGLAKKDSASSAPSGSSHAGGTDNSVQVNVSGNNGSSITVVLQSPTITKGEK
jgi:hypothetical protein